MALNSLQEIIDRSLQNQKAFWEVVMEDDLTEREISKQESMDQMYQICWPPLPMTLS